MEEFLMVSRNARPANFNPSSEEIQAIEKFAEDAQQKKTSE